MNRGYIMMAAVLAGILLTSTLIVLPLQSQAAESKKYPAEVLSSKTTNTYEDNGIQVKEKTQKIKVRPETYEELLADNQEYFDFLESTLGEEGKKIVEDEKAKLKDLADKEKAEGTVDVVEVGTQSITFGKALRETSTGPNKDPVNLVWYNNGRVIDVDTALRTNTR